MLNHFILNLQKLTFCSYINNIERTLVLNVLRPMCLFHNKNLKEINEKKYYVVIKGHVPGIYFSWEDCDKQVLRYSNPICKKFMKKVDALLFLKTELDNLKHNSTNVPKVLLLEKILAHYRSVWKEVVHHENLVWDNHVKFLLNGLTFDGNGYLEIYTDGSYYRSFRGITIDAGAVGVYFGDGCKLNTSTVVKKAKSSSDVEVQAILAGLAKAQEAGYYKVKVLTDCEVAIHSIIQMKRFGINHWSNRNTCGNIAVTVTDLDKLLSSMDMLFVHVSYLSNTDGNYKADKMARNCARTYVEKNLGIQG